MTKVEVEVVSGMRLVEVGMGMQKEVRMGNFQGDT